jgi:GNAT superfamily N-acetyltransferase
MLKKIIKRKKNDFIIEKLSEKNNERISQFCSYEKDLVDFLLEDAYNNQKSNISTTYLWFDKKTKQLAAYITILTDSISLSHELKDKFKEKGITYKSLPALKIGRLCVDDNYLRQGIGSLLIKFTLAKVIEINSTAGCRFITLDAKNNPDTNKDPLHFYKKMDFSILRKRKKGTTPMFRDVQPILKAYNEEKNVKGKNP